MARRQSCPASQVARKAQPHHAPGQGLPNQVLSLRLCSTATSVAADCRLPAPGPPSSLVNARTGVSSPRCPLGRVLHGAQMLKDAVTQGLSLRTQSCLCPQGEHMNQELVSVHTSHSPPSPHNIHTLLPLRLAAYSGHILPGLKHQPGRKLEPRHSQGGRGEQAGEPASCS